MVFDREEDWILVQSKEGGKAGFVPGNYVEEVCTCIEHVDSYLSRTQTTGVENTPPASVAPHIVIPPSVR